MRSTASDMAAETCPHRAYPSELWHERLADGVVHGLGIVSVAVACTILLIAAAFKALPAIFFACVVYCVTVLLSFITSASYHLLPAPAWRRALRRLDHLAIYALIAGTFTPLLIHIGTTWALTVLVLIWALAIPAMIYKLIGNKIDTRWSLASYLALGWLGALAIPDLGQHLPMSAVIAILVGGLVYTAGTFFYVRKSQVYRNAIWHSFVLAGTGFLFFAVWTTVFTEPSIAG